MDTIIHINNNNSTSTGSTSNNNNNSSILKRNKSGSSAILPTTITNSNSTSTSNSATNSTTGFGSSTNRVVHQQQRQNNNNNMMNTDETRIQPIFSSPPRSNSLDNHNFITKNTTTTTNSTRFHLQQQQQQNFLLSPTSSSASSSTESLSPLNSPNSTKKRKKSFTFTIDEKNLHKNNNNNPWWSSILLFFNKSSWNYTNNHNHNHNHSQQQHQHQQQKQHQQQNRSLFKNSTNRGITNSLQLSSSLRRRHIVQQSCAIIVVVTVLMILYWDNTNNNNQNNYLINSISSSTSTSTSTTTTTTTNTGTTSIGTTSMANIDSTGGDTTATGSSSTSSSSIQYNIDDVYIIIISDTINGIIPSIGSVLAHTKHPVHVCVISNSTIINQQVYSHFMIMNNKNKQSSNTKSPRRLHSFIGLTIYDIEIDLLTNTKYIPTWKWNTNNNTNNNNEWHSSIIDNVNNKYSWYTNYTVHPGLWDNNIEHTNTIHQIYYYIPHITILQQKWNSSNYIYVIENDILIQKDLGTIVQSLVVQDQIQQELEQEQQEQTNNNNNVDNTNFLYASCNGWVWSNICQQFIFYKQMDTIWNMPALYNNKNSGIICTSIDQYECIPQSYTSILQYLIQNIISLLTTTSNDNNNNNNNQQQRKQEVEEEVKHKLHTTMNNQIGWNFGFTIMNKKNWYNQKATERYEYVMKENYKQHIYLETSLSFRLGIPYIAFAGNVQCFSEQEEQEQEQQEEKENDYVSDNIEKLENNKVITEQENIDNSDEQQQQQDKDNANTNTNEQLQSGGQQQEPQVFDNDNTNTNEQTQSVEQQQQEEEHNNNNRRTTSKNNNNNYNNRIVLKVRDGFGFIDWERMKETFNSATTNDVFATADIIHYSGLQKPWEDYYRMDTNIVIPWYTVMYNENLVPLPKQFHDKYTITSIRTTTTTTTTTTNTNTVEESIQLIDDTTGSNNDSIIPQLFIVLGGTRTGGYWLMSQLDSDPNICSTGEHTNGESGFPAEILYPYSMDWNPLCSVKRTCSYSYVRDNILQMTQLQQQQQQQEQGGEHRHSVDRCATDYDSSNDDDKKNIQRLCLFKEKLYGNYTIEHITKVWVDAFVNEDNNFLQCKCQRGIHAKGIKIVSDWIHYQGYPNENTGPPLLSLNDTKILLPNDYTDDSITGSNTNNDIYKPTKLIRMKRSNLWSRYKSMEIAKLTKSFWHVSSIQEKVQQVKTLQNEIYTNHHGGMTINLKDLKESIKYMIQSDNAGDEWANNNIINPNDNILWLEYDDCKNDIVQCFNTIYTFLGLEYNSTIRNDTGQQQDNNNKNYYYNPISASSLFVSDNFYNSFDNNHNHNHNITISSINSINKNLDYIKNWQQVQELLVENNWSHFLH